MRRWIQDKVSKFDCDDIIATPTQLNCLEEQFKHNNGYWDDHKIAKITKAADLDTADAKKRLFKKRFKYLNQSRDPDTYDLLQQKRMVKAFTIQNYRLNHKDKTWISFMKLHRISSEKLKELEDLTEDESFEFDE